MEVLAISEQIQVNQQIEIEVKSGPYKGTYPSKIAAINEEFVKIYPPFKSESVVPLRPGSDIFVFFTGDDAAYKFNSKVIRRIKENIHLLVIEPPEEIVRIQRRNYFRLEVKRDVRYRLINDDLEPIQDYVDSKTIDISGGGVKLILNSELEENDLVEMLIDIPDLSDVPLPGEVKQIYSLPDGKAVGIEFINLKRRVRDQIIGWLFDYQRQLRRKGLL
ncbi:MAG: flagellar brake protein [Bacillota bacterium]